MRKLIEINQDTLIMCDNKTCDFTVKNESGDPFQNCDEYLNKPCPKCGENLLTQEDYDLSKKVEKMVKFLNRWFSWLTIFIPKKKEVKMCTLHVHKGLNIEE